MNNRLNFVIKLVKSDFKCFLHNYSPSITSVNDVDAQQKVLKVVVLGMPNVGKSTFINNLMDRKVCPTSSKVHTTRANARAIFTQGDSQIIFLDTPGLVKFSESRKYKLERSFLKDSKNGLEDADVIGVIHDAVSPRSSSQLDYKVLDLLKEFIEKPSFLVLNKIDKLKSKKKLLEITRVITANCIKGKPVMSNAELPEDIKGWPHFEEIFMVSALTGNGLAEVKDYLVNKAKPDRWLFDAESWTDQKPEILIVNTVKATLLDFLQQEIPYQLHPTMEYFEMNETGVISTVVIVKCVSARVAKLVAGDNNGRLKQIMEKCQIDLQNGFQQPVRIRIVLEPPYEGK